MISASILIGLTALLYVVTAQDHHGVPVGLPPGAVPAELPGQSHGAVHAKLPGPPPGAIPAKPRTVEITEPGPLAGSKKTRVPHKKPVPNYGKCDVMSYDDEEEQWVCPEKDYFDVSVKYLEDQLYGSLQANYQYALHIADTSTCHNGWREKAAEGKNAVYKYTKMCNTERREIQYVYDYYEDQGAWYRDVCVVFPGQWLFSVKCTHPDYYKPRGKGYTNHCKIGYAYIRGYRCMPNAFIDRKVVVWCRDQYKFKWFQKRVATTCSCMQCPNGCPKYY